jgi:cytoskeletal protein RodZ
MQHSIGQKLKAAREKAGLSLLDAAHETRIPVGRLQMLESDNFAAFGNMAYARSFLKNYSSFLGVDAGEELDQFPSPVFGGPEDYRYLTRTHGQWIRRRQRPPSPAPLSRSRHSPVLGMVGIVSILVIASALVGSQLLGWQKPNATEEERPEGTEPSATSSTAVETPSSSDVVEADELPDLGLETVVRPAVIPSSIPAPDSPNTPVRRPEIVE